MLSKLLKYEFKSLSKTASTVFGLIFLSAVSTALLSRLASGIASSEGQGMGFVATQFNTFAMIGIFALIASPFIALILVINRFYTNFFKDEGYLTFTLPVKVSSLYNAKLIAGVVTVLLTGLFAIFGAGFVIMILTGDSTAFFNTKFITEIFEFIKMFFAYNVDMTAWIIIIELIIYFIIESIGFLMLVMLSISISSSKLIKYRIAAGVGIYFALKSAKDIINSIIILILAGTLPFTEDSVPSLENLQIVPYFLLITIIVSLAIYTFAYIYNNKVLRNSLNLE